MSASLVLKLPGAELAEHPALLREALTSLLSAELGEGRTIVHCRSTVRRAVPEKRCVFECEITLGGGEGEQPARRRILAKIYSKDQGERAHEIITALRGCGFASGACRVPRPLAYDATRRLSLLEWVGGRSLRELLLAGECHPSLMEHAAAWIGRLHSSGVGAGRSYDFARHLHTLGRWSDRIAALLPSRAKCVSDLLRTIQERGAELAGWQPGPTHRDFSPDHLLIDGGVATGLDFDEFCQYDRMYDIAHFVIHLRYLALLHFSAPDRFDRLGAHFVSAYRLCAPDFSQARMRLYESIACLKLAHIVASVTRVNEWRRFAGILLKEAQRRL